MGEIKQANFRIDQETADKFRKFCDANGLNQAQGFDHLMQVLELDRAKSAVPERQVEMEEFERSIKAIMSAYLQSVEISNNAEKRAKEQFAGQLASRDETIADLQKQREEITAAMSAADQMRQDADHARDEAETRAAAATRELTAIQSALADKEKVNSVLAEKLAGQEKKLAEHDALAACVEEYKKQIAELSEKLKDAERAIRSKEDELASERKQMELSAQLAAKEAAMETERGMMEKIREADKENALLQAKIEQLQERLDAVSAAGEND